MNAKQRSRQLKRRQQHSTVQNAKRKAGEKTTPQVRRKQPRKPKG